MWGNAATQRNVAQLRTDAIEILGPGSGDQACGEIGDGRMLEPEEILAALLASAQPKLLAGKRVLLTAGPTFEAIDPVRGITNSSSGKMGFALAQACAESGAEVTLIAGPSAVATPRSVTRVNVTSAADMASAVDSRVAACDIFIAVAAVADYAPAEARAVKLKKSEQPLTLTLEPTVDILATVAARAKAAVLRRLRGRNERSQQKRRGQTPAKEAAAADRQSGAGYARPGPQRSHASRR